jgi:hypothetical protein
MQSTPALKLNVLIFFPAYGGNGGISSEHPDIRQWAVETILKMKADPRVGQIFEYTVADTPITMTRNRAVVEARRRGAHVLIMVDSDQSPNKHRNDPGFKPFWDVAFTEIYNHYQAGPLVIGAPYCGPPDGSENVYVFQWDDLGDRASETCVQLNQYTRAQAAIMSGVQECAALPTGLIMYDMRAFDLIEPTGRERRLILEDVQAGKLSIEKAARELHQGWFYYEWTDQTASEKASTEDVTNTRDISLAGMRVLGYNPVRCAWDSWVGHHKPWNVGKPKRTTVEQISSMFAHAVENGDSIRERIVNVDLTKGFDLSQVRGSAPVSPQPESGEKVRDLFGHKVTSFVHQTPIEHLESLRNLCYEERGRKDRVINIWEIGSWVGESAIAMASIGDGVHVRCVDTWGGTNGDITGTIASQASSKEIYRRFLQNTRELPNIHARRGESIEVAKDLRSQVLNYPIDLIFIDGDHSYEATKADILAWWPLLDNDGVMIGHDFQTQQFPGVDRAVREIFGAFATPYAIGPTGGFWMVRKADLHGFCLADIEERIKNIASK